MRKSNKARSARLHLLSVIVAAVIPVWLFAAYLLAQYALIERERFTKDAIQVAQQASVPVEGYLARLVTIVVGLSRSKDLATGNYDEFRLEASRWVAGTKRSIAVRRGNAVLLDTDVVRGVLIPTAHVLPNAEASRLEGGSPVVSNVYFNDATRDFRIAVSLMLDDGRILQISAPTAEVFDALKPAVPKGWIVAIGDRNGAYISRSEMHEKVTGTPGLPEYVDKVVGSSGTFSAKNFQGTELLAGYFRSAFSDWFYTANVPLTVVRAPMLESMTAIGLSALVALAVSATLAHFIGNSLAHSATRLATQASNLGRGKPVEPVATSVAEFDVISRALCDAQANLAKGRGELQAVFETAPAAIWVTYDPNALVVVRNRFAAELMGIQDVQTHSGAPDEVVETIALKNGTVVPREDRPLARAMRGETTENQEFTYIVADGTERVLLSSARPIRHAEGNILGAVQISLDISDRKKAWQQRQLLVSELSHRVKNTMAVVQSIASQTLRNAPDLKSAAVALNSRLVSVARAHDLLLQESWSGADLRELIEGTLDPHAERTRYEMVGESVWLPPNVALSLALALHELTTNAVKYGALSNASGRITITWRLDNAQRLNLQWREDGGPPVKEPDRKGFGTRLLERMFDKRSSERVEIDLRPEGLFCIIQADIALPDTPKDGSS